jgi:hypothetical protein
MKEVSNESDLRRLGGHESRKDREKERGDLHVDEWFGVFGRCIGSCR